MEKRDVGGRERRSASAELSVAPQAMRKTHCADCVQRDRCLPAGLDLESTRRFDHLVGRQRRLRKDGALFRPGDDFLAVYVIRIGSMSTSAPSEDGREQVMGYHITGDIVGLDGIAAGKHLCSAVALEDGEVCVVPFGRLETLAFSSVELQRNMRQMAAREIKRLQDHCLVLGGMTAEQRVVSFLLDLSARYRRMGYSATEFVLRMLRIETASYLGLTVETVCRVLSKLQSCGAIRFRARNITLVNPPQLRALLDRMPA